MLNRQGKQIKTDKRDARLIAQRLCYGGYHPVYIPTGEDDAVKEHLRMRGDRKLALEKLKQLEPAPMYRETLDEYMASYEEQETK